MLTKRESLEETRLPLKINLYVTIWTSAILAERLESVDVEERVQ